MSRPVDPVLVTELTRAVQDALVAEATARVQAGGPRLTRAGQEALADSVLREQLQRIDADRLSSGAGMLDDDAEQALVERVLALSVGLGSDRVAAGRPESVEEIVATRFDLVFVYRSDGSVEQLDERLWASEAEMAAWLSHLARTAGRTERQFNAPGAAAGDAPRRRACAWPRPATCPSTCRSRCAATRSARSRWPISSARACCPGRWPSCCAACMRSTRDPHRVLRSDRLGQDDAGAGLPRRAAGRMARVVIIEDTAEIDLFDPVLHPNVESWEARLANNEGEGAITQGQQVKHALAVPARLAGVRRGPRLRCGGADAEGDDARPVVADDRALGVRGRRARQARPVPRHGRGPAPARGGAQPAAPGDRLRRPPRPWVGRPAGGHRGARGRRVRRPALHDEHDRRPRSDGGEVADAAPARAAPRQAAGRAGFDDASLGEGFR